MTTNEVVRKTLPFVAQHRLCMIGAWLHGATVYILCHAGYQYPLNTRYSTWP